MNARGNGPRFNDLTTRFSSRDCLGIESVAASISAAICPIVNTVTPRAFYWPFMCWIYYDFYKHSGIEQHDVRTFDRQFLKRQDYFFVLSNLLVKNPDQYNLVGKQKTAIDIANNPEGPYPFNPKYFITTYGGMQYYNAGCLTMQFIVLRDEDTFPKLTQYGEEMALAFENVIKNTTYFKQYRLRNIPVPKDVLIEYGQVINLGLKGFNECKVLLKEQMFKRIPYFSERLSKEAEYARRIYDITGKRSLSLAEARHVLYDYYSPRGEENDCPEVIQEAVRGWEIVIGRQYFAAGIEMIWKYMLSCLTEPLSQEEWVSRSLNLSEFSFPVTNSLEKIISQSIYTFDEREAFVEKARKSGNDPHNVENGLSLMLSVFNRFISRDDLLETEVFLNNGRGVIPGTGAISLTEWFDTVERYRVRPVRDLLEYIMREYVVEQHKRTCFEKLTRSSQSVDGFYFELIDDLYIRNEHVFQLGFQGLRILQLMQVMEDLDMFDERT